MVSERNAEGRVYARAARLGYLLWAAVLLTGAAPAALEDTGAALGLASQIANWPTVGWIDLDQDGAPEPLWISNSTALTLHPDEDGELSVHVVTIPKAAQKTKGNPTLSLGVLDANRDGTSELLVIGEEIHLLQVDSKDVLKDMGLAMPTLPGVTVRDVAIGDLNADGWPDIVLAVGIFALERVGLGAAPDLVLMNMGQGRFELQELSHVHMAFSNGMTLVDMDDDGRLDIVESIDFSSFNGFSHILLNRTKPGARTPVFEVSEAVIDTGVNGMGMAVGDLNQDGHLDLYNTSMGLDQLWMGQGDGSFQEETFQRGILHEWAASGQRMQWSPSFVDLNLDGLLDIIVRHGAFGIGAMDSAATIVAKEAADLLYLQEEDHTFTRVPAPGDGKWTGRQMVVGDLSMDGAPDVAVGGENAAAGFWRNQTAVDNDVPRLTVRFHSTVSAWPPTGATVVGTCGGQTHTRHLTRGGKMGGAPAVELYLAWPGCTEGSSVVIRWPTGAQSSHQVPVGELVLEAQEPRWWWMDDDKATVVSVEPGVAGSEGACVGVGDGATQCCSAADEPCVLTVPDINEEEAAWVRLDDEAPMALPRTPPYWSLVTVPSPPRPGEPVDFIVRHGGDPADFDSSAASIFINGTFLPWGSVDEAARTLEATWDEPQFAPDLTVSLLPLDLPPTPTWSVPTGWVLDTRWTVVDVYPNRVLGGVTELWDWTVHVTGYRGMKYTDALAQLSLVGPDGELLNSQLVLEGSTVSRMRLAVGWDQLEGLETIYLRDGVLAAGIPLPVIAPMTLEEATAAVVAFEGGLSRGRLTDNGDISVLFLILLDANGYRISPEPELIYLEVDGAVPSAPLLAPGGGGITSLIKTTPGTETGEVRVFAADGRFIGAVPIQKRPLGESMLSLEHTTVHVSPTFPSPILTGPYTVHAKVRNAFGEVLGASAKVEVEFTGGQIVDSLSVWPEGYQGVTFEQLPGYDQVEIDVYADGHFIAHLVQEVDFIPIPEVEPEPEPDVPAPVPDISGEASEERSTDPPPPLTEQPVQEQRDDGCAGAGPLAPWYLGVLGALLFLCRRRRTLPLILACCVLGLSGPARGVVAVSMEDIAGNMGLNSALLGFAAPTWFDIDGDGRLEPLWISRDGLMAGDLDGTGKLVPHPVTLIGTTLEVVGSNLAGGLYSPYSLVVLDGDRDGVDELMVVGARITVLERTAPHELTAMDVPMPALPAVSVRDSAVGDMNGDGWPEIVLATGIMATEYVGNLRGAADLVLMNIGEGRYEVQPIEPQRNAFNNGITLMDMDGDGRLDVVESVDNSQFQGPSRILLNRTEAGDMELTFEVHPHSFDPGTNGMGAAIGDVNEDGYLDVYNTSIGLDSLALGKPDGSFEDVTIPFGITHRWGSSAYRSQWTPTFADLNADGRLDILVRFGSYGLDGGGETSLVVVAEGEDLIYVQGEDGHFSRNDVPFEPGSPCLGRQAVLGDLDDDGLPDVLLGGGEQSSTFWRNTTQLPPDAVLLTVRFSPSVSPSPPTGALLTGTCGASTIHRHLDSGGKRGAMQAPEVYMAWPGCTAIPQITVQWPSGVVTTHQPEPGSLVLVAEEPLWWQVDPQDPSGVVLTPPEGETACIGSDGAGWTCCQSDQAPCSLSVSALNEDRPLVRLGQSRPLALPHQPTRWILNTDPSPIRPGEEVVFTVQHQGDPQTFDPDPTALTLFVQSPGGTSTGLYWTSVDEERRSFQTKTTAPSQGGQVSLTLFPVNLPPEPTWMVPTGQGMDPGWAWIDAYPWNITGGITEVWDWEAFIVCLRTEPPFTSLGYLRLSTPTGEAIPFSGHHASPSVARVRITTSWEELVGLDHVVIGDGFGSFSQTVPIHTSIPMEEALDWATEVRGGINGPRLYEGGDVGLVYATLVGPDGYVMPPEPELVSFEVEGGELSDPPALLFGAYYVFGSILTDPEPGPGEVRVHLADGRLIGTYHFTRLPRTDSGISPEHSWTTLETVSPGETGVTHELYLHAHNTFGEAVGAAARVKLEITGGAVITEPTLNMFAVFVSGLEMSPYASEMSVSVYVDDLLVDTLSVDNPDPRARPVERADASSDLVGDMADVPDPGPSLDGADAGPSPPQGPPSTTERSSGCGAADRGASGVAWLLLLWLPLIRPPSRFRALLRG